MLTLYFVSQRTSPRTVVRILPNEHPFKRGTLGFSSTTSFAAGCLAYGVRAKRSELCFPYLFGGDIVPSLGLDVRMH
jgi:hypothetical protein